MLTEGLKTRRQNARGAPARGERLRADDIIGFVPHERGLTVDDPPRRPEDDLTRSTNGLSGRVPARGNERKLRFALAGFGWGRLLGGAYSGERQRDMKSDTGGSKMCMHAR